MTVARLISNLLMMRFWPTGVVQPPLTPLLSAAAAGLATLAITRPAPRLAPWVACGLAAAHALDFEHFFRMLLQDTRHALRGAEGRSRPVLSPDTCFYRVYPTDLDQNGHLNNAKYVRILNYARRSLWQRNGVWHHCLTRSPKANLIVTAATIRYRREIKSWQRFAVVSHLAHWDAQCFYIESRFESLETTPFVLAIALVKCMSPSPRPSSPHALRSVRQPTPLERVPQTGWSHPTSWRRSRCCASSTRPCLPRAHRRPQSSRRGKLTIRLRLPHCGHPRRALLEKIFWL